MSELGTSLNSYIFKEFDQEELIAQIYEQVFEELDIVWANEFKRNLDVKIDELNGQVHLSLTMSKKLYERFPELFQNWKEEIKK